VHNLSRGNEFDLQDNDSARKSHFSMKGFARGLVLKQRHKVTRKWPIEQGSLPIRNTDILYRKNAQVLSSSIQITGG